MAQAVRLAAEDETLEHEVLATNGSDTSSLRPSAELAATHFADVPLMSELPGHATLVSHVPGMALEAQNLLAGQDVPKPDEIRSRGQPAPVPSERHAADVVAMTLDRTQMLASDRVPDLDVTIAARRGDPAPRLWPIKLLGQSLVAGRNELG